MIEVQCITVGMFQVNTYLVRNTESGHCVLIDTGEGDELPRRLSSLVPPPDIVGILLTHAHLDHAGALEALQKLFDVPTYLPAPERVMFETLPRQGDWFGMSDMNRPCGRIDYEVGDGEVVVTGSLQFRFLATPGHSPGQGCYYTDTDVFVGDTLFAGSIGRTDLPMGDPHTMRESLRRLMALPGHLRVHPGHGPATTLDQELRTNPFLGYLRRERGLPEGASYSW